MRGGLRLGVCVPLGVSDRATGLHQMANETGPLRFTEARVGHAPQPATDDEVATVGRHRILHVTQADLRRAPDAGFFAAASLAGFLPAIGISISF